MRGKGIVPCFVHQLPQQLELVNGQTLEISCSLHVGGCKPGFIRSLPGIVAITAGDDLEVKCVCDNTKIAVNVSGNVVHDIADKTLAAAIEAQPTVESHVKIMSVPDPPNSLYITNITDDYVSIEWEKPECEGGSPVSEYILEKLDEGGDTWQLLARLPANVYDCQLENMDPDKTYLLRVCAINRFGRSQPMELPEPICMEEAMLGPPLQPGRPQVSEIGDDFVTVTWNAPASDGGCDILSYIVEIREIQGPQNLRIFECQTSDISFTAYNLANDFQYEFQIYAKNEMGLSDASDTLRLSLDVHNEIDVPPRFLGEMLGQTVNEGDVAKFECKVTGRPVPCVRWFRNCAEIFHGHKYKLLQDNEMCILIISNVALSDCGEIECRAYNDVGTATTRAKLILTGPSKQVPPSVEFDDLTDMVQLNNILNSDNKTCTEVSINVPSVTKCLQPGKPWAVLGTANSVQLKWQHIVSDQSLQVLYIVEIMEDGDAWQRCYVTSSKQVTVNELLSKRTYQFRIIAKTGDMYSEPSQPCEPLTTPAQPINYDQFVAADVPYSRVFIQETQDNTLSKYRICEELGRGAFGCVNRAVELGTGMSWAAKFVPHDNGRRVMVAKEVAIMSTLHHPKLLQLHQVFHRPDDTVLIVEFLAGPDLFARLADPDYIFTEYDAVIYMRQVCQAIAYLHKKNIIHLDLKMENVVCTTRHGKEVKLIDFGLAQQVVVGQSVFVCYGTTDYCAPEVVCSQPVGKATDMWSLGIFAYTLLTGVSPFRGSTPEETFSNIVRDDVYYPNYHWNSITTDAQDWIGSLLIKEKGKRLTIGSALHHPWLTSIPWKQASTATLSTDVHKRSVKEQQWRREHQIILGIGCLAESVNTLQATAINKGSLYRELVIDQNLEDLSEGCLVKHGSESFVISEDIYSTAPSFTIQLPQKHSVSKGSNLEVKCKFESELASNDGPYFVFRLRDRDIKDGSCTKFCVKVKSASQVDIFWLHNGAHIASGDLAKDSGKFKADFRDGLHSLELLCASVSDAGVYTCSATDTNTGLTTHTSCTLTVSP